MKNGIKTKLKKEYQSVKQFFASYIKSVNHLFRQRKFWKIQLLNIWSGLETVLKQVASSMLVLLLTATIIKSLKISGLGGEFINIIILTLFWYNFFLEIVIPLIKGLFTEQFSKIIRPQLIQYLLMMPFMILGPVHAIQQNFYPSLYSVLSLWLFVVFVHMNKRLEYRKIQDQLTDVAEFQEWIPYISKMSTIKQKAQIFDTYIETTRDSESNLVYSGFYTRNKVSVEITLKYSHIAFRVTHAIRLHGIFEPVELHNLEFEDWPLLSRGYPSSLVPTKLNQKKGKENVISNKEKNDSL